MKKVLAIATAGMIALGVAIAWLFVHSAPAASTAREAVHAVPVVVAPVIQRDMPLSVTALGTVQAFNSVLVKPRVDGTLDQVAFVEGKAVHRGDLLAQIDPRPYQAQLQAAQAQKAHDAAQLANTERDIQRYTYLASQKIYPQQQLDTTRSQADALKATVAQDQAQIDNARVQLEYTTIRAPLDGLTGARLVDAGNMVHATDTTGLVLITQVHPIYVSFNLPQDALPALLSARAHGAVAVIASNRDASQLLDHGELSLIDNQIDATTGTIHCKATFANQQETLWPGQFVSLRIVLSTQHNALTVPSAAVQQGSNGNYVFVIKPDNTAELRQVNVASNENDTSVITRGLNQGDRVVVQGQFKLEDGTAVRIAGDAARDGTAP
ncbi:efflux RND transporter periplasmic adaptor subunit [Dyella psychrodurans]|uniref:Efflux RND transporter periplasmic adaptor subunit n=1 Tax=Dyella psychrodurans TaxID=1927960 RepID=A0A370X6X1_9GAMM|nr:efflux RND transporter periplasmic adaptor subunit [Dyella psychrodurans]RDS84184.1 efflux RND transporter periplasmic adaptor subunit [Dyella psychrodurans]